MMDRTAVTKTSSVEDEHRPSIAVLPFVNMSGEMDQDYLVDGITEDIITALTRFRSFFVIARNSSFAYKEKRLTQNRSRRNSVYNTCLKAACESPASTSVFPLS